MAATAAVEDAALSAVVDGIAADAVVVELRAPFALIADAHPPRPGGDALPTVTEIRGMGALGATVAVVVVAVVIGGFLTGSWPLAALVVGVALGALVLARFSTRA